MITQEEMSRENIAQPQQLPRPTYYPFCFAFSLLFVGAGLLTSWILSVAGVAGMFISLVGWVKEMLND